MTFQKDRLEADLAYDVVEDNMRVFDKVECKNWRNNARTGHRAGESREGWMLEREARPVKQSEDLAFWLCLKMYLSKLQNVFVKIFKYIFLHIA